MIGKKRHGTGGHRLLAGAVALALLALTVGGLAFAVEWPARPEAAPSPTAGPQPPEPEPTVPAPPPTPPAAVPRDPKQEPPLPAPQASSRPLSVTGDDGLRDLAERLGAHGRGTAEDPIVVNGADLVADPRDSLQLRDTRLHLIISDLALNGTDGIGVRLLNVTNVHLQRLNLTGHHTGVLLDGSEHVRISHGWFEANRMAIQAVGARSVHVDGATFVDNTHALAVATMLQPGDALRPSSSVQFLNNTVLARPRHDGPGLPTGSGVRLTGDAHTVENNTFAGHAPAGLRAKGAGLSIRANHFQGGAGHGLLLVNATDALAEQNTFGDHGDAAAISFAADDLRILANRFAGARAGAYAGVHGTHLLFSGNLVADSTTGVSLWSTRDARIEENVFTAGARAVRVFEGERVTILNNDVSYHRETVFLLDHVVEPVLAKNRVQGSAPLGAHLGGTQRARIEDNRFAVVDQGILITAGATDSRIIANRVQGQGTVGIRVHDATGTVLAANQIRNFDIGILAEEEARTLRLQDGVIKASNHGVRLLAATGVRLTDLNVSDNRVGLSALGGESHRLRALTLLENDRALLIEETQRLTLRDSRLADNRLGLHFINSTHNLVFNNVFENGFRQDDRDVRLEGSPDNRWNTTKTAGPNILGGPWIAGNHWHDYLGLDVDGDGIGEIPHQPLPYHPVLEQPVAALGQSVGPFDLHPLVPQHDLPLSAPHPAPSERETLRL